MKYLLLGIVCVTVLLLACNNNSTKNKSTVKAAFVSGPMDTAYMPIRPQLQVFTINNTQATTIKANKGTEILIPAHCFINTNGEPVVGDVKIELVEAFSMPDFITAGLATMSGDKLLISNGMIYINAKSGDNVLQLDKSLPLTVSMPTKGGNQGFKMFTGDGKNWTVDSAMTENDYDIPLPLNLLYPTGNKYFWFCITDMGGKNEKYAYFDTTIISVTNPKYENTVIATTEFGRRYGALRVMMEYTSYFANKEYYMTDLDCMKQHFNYDILKVYFDHPNRPLAESDTIAKKMYVDYLAANENKLNAFFNEVNIRLRKYYSNWTDTNYYFDFRKHSFREDYMKAFEYFPKENKPMKLIDDHGVNLNAGNAYNLLKQKGVSEKEINEILGYNFKRQSIIKQLQREKDAMADKQKIAGMYETTAFSVTTMGWINCDMFYNDPAAAKAAIYVTNTSNNKLSFMDCSLVIPDLNVRLMSFPAKGDSYSFTQSDGRYTNLPIGKAAVVVSVSMQHDSLFFASKKINIKDGLNIGLPMKYIPTNALKDSLLLALK